MTDDVKPEDFPDDKIAQGKPIADHFHEYLRREREKRGLEPGDEMVREALSSYTSFSAGWSARFEAAKHAVYADPEFKILLSAVTSYQTRATTHFNSYMAAVADNRRLRRENDQLRDHSRARRDWNVNDGPMYRRIMNQRRALRTQDATIVDQQRTIERLQTENRQLRGAE